MIDTLSTTSNPTIAEIQSVVCDIYGVRMDEFLSARRAREVARPRQVAMFLCKALTAHSLPTIGYHMGRRDHTTIMHGVRNVEKLWRTDLTIEQAVAYASEKLAAIVADRVLDPTEMLAA